MRRSASPSPSQFGRPTPLSESSLRSLGSVRSRPRVPSAASNASTLRSRLESETDYGGDDLIFYAPRPRHYSANTLQPWMQAPEPELSAAATPPSLPQRVASPLGQPVLPDRLSPSAPRSTSSFVATGATGEVFSRPSTLLNTALDSPLRRLVRWAGKMGLRDALVPSVVSAALLVRVLVGLGGYSGEGVTPMYGDYEAQRHWVEITIHLPISRWYTYDLSYWGLDYPPLTAYVSWLCGRIGSLVSPSWFALDESRGFESSSSKAFMRLSVLAFDALVYIPSVVLFVQTFWKSRSHRSQAIATATVLLQPALILIDNGHFQYNSVMLGLTIWSLCLFQLGYDALAAVAFVLSLSFKQMALYYSPAIFGYCLGKCIYLGRRPGFDLLVKFAATVLITFGVVFSPFILTRNFPADLLQVVTRMFPFGRGLFEDKVANFWGASNVIFKWRESALRERLPLISLFATLMGILPSLLHVIYISWQSSSSSQPMRSIPEERQKEQSPQNSWLRHFSSVPPSPAAHLLPLALFNSSMAFFLFSFQVHEKSILLPLMPFTLVMSARDDLGPENVGVWDWGMLFNNVAVFSMWPLLFKDGQSLQYLALLVGWNYALGYNPLRLPSSFVKLITLAAFAAASALHLSEAAFNPPARYPDLFPVLNMLICAPVFGVCWIYGMKRQLEVGFAMTSR